MKRLFAIIPALVLSILMLGCNTESDLTSTPDALEKNPSFSAEYEVTLENLTPEGSQPFSPPVFAVHSQTFRLFQIGGFASAEVAGVAQDGNNPPLIDMLNNDPEVMQVVAGSGAIMPGLSAMFTVNAAGNYTKLSMVTMLVNTNDGFTGVDKIQLPQTGTKVYYLRAYDAGSEQNTELMAHIPGPCCGNPFMGIPSNERIMFHKGIMGNGDLDPLVYGWDEPVAKLTITRIN